MRKVCENMIKREIVMIGGDIRQYYLAVDLLNSGYGVSAYGEIFDQQIPGVKKLEGKAQVWEKLQQDYSILVLPVPVSMDGEFVKGGKTICLSELCVHMGMGESIFGGKVSKGIELSCEKKHGICVDFMNVKEVAEKNAVPTAEGAITEASILGNCQLTNSECLIMGYGICGTVLADKLNKFGAKVTVMEQKEEKRVKARKNGLEAISFLETDELKKYTYLFNTVPAMVADEAFLKQCSLNLCMIDLASAPGGIDFEYAKKAGMSARLCPGLPGKYAPKTAGEILAEQIRKEIRDYGKK